MGAGVRKAERGDLMGKLSHIAVKYQYNPVCDRECEGLNVHVPSIFPVPQCVGMWRRDPCEVIGWMRS